MRRVKEFGLFWCTRRWLELSKSWLRTRKLSCRSRSSPAKADLNAFSCTAFPEEWSTWLPFSGHLPLERQPSHLCQIQLAQRTPVGLARRHPRPELLVQSEPTT